MSFCDQEEFLVKVTFASFSYTRLAKLEKVCSKHQLVANEIQDR